MEPASTESGLRERSRYGSSRQRPGGDNSDNGGDARYPEIGNAAVPALVKASIQRNAGRKLAFELVSTGRILGAEEMSTFGLANRIVAPEAVLDVALETATIWAAAPSKSMTGTKSLF